MSQGQYALWVGSGISRERVIGLDGVLAKLLEFVRGQIAPDPNCDFRKALDKIVDMALPSKEERDAIDLARDPRST